MKEIEQNINNGKPYVRCKRIENKYVKGFENNIKVNKSVEKDDVQILSLGKNSLKVKILFTNNIVSLTLSWLFFFINIW